MENCSRMSILTAVRAIELVLLSAGLVYSAVMIRGSFSTTSSYVFLVSSFEKPLSMFRTWLSSPLLICIFINFMVILIAVSSNFHHTGIQSQSDPNTGDYGICGLERDSSSPPPPRKSQKRPIRPKDTAVRAPKYTSEALKQYPQDSVESLANGVRGGVREKSQPEVSRLARGKDIKKELAAAMDAWTLPEIKGPEDIHLDSSQEINRIRKPVEERGSAAEADDTMEATWMAINGRTKPPEKQLKKSKTWPEPPEVVLAGDERLPEKMAQKKEMRKSMTFNDTVTIRCRGGLRRDPTMNLEELNQRVEAFIQNFNHEMRLQRQESHQRYLDLISQRL